MSNILGSDISLQLFSEVSSVCVKNNIRYYIIGDAAINMYLHDEFATNGSIAIYAEDANRFLKAIQKELNETRGLDFMKENPRFPSCFFRYSDLNTVDCTLDKLRLYKYNCIHLDIKLIKGTGKSGIKASFQKKIYQAYKISNVLSTKGKSMKYKALRQGTIFFRRVLGMRFSANRAYNAFISSSNAQGKNVKIGKYKYERNVFDKPVKMDRKGLEVWFPSDIERYFQITYGEKWSHSNVKQVNLSKERVLSKNTKWEDFQQRLIELGINNYYKNIKRYERQNRMFNIYNKKVRKYYDILERTNDRFLLYTQFFPRKDELLELYKKQDFYTLKRILKPYILSLEKNAKKGLGVCFDKDIFDITMEIYVHEGKIKRSKVLRNLVPEDHWKPIRIKDYNGKYINFDKGQCQ